MYRIAIPFRVSLVMGWLKTGSSAASVFPLAVGETSRTFLPRRI
jgi:hypothetical protein